LAFKDCSFAAAETRIPVSASLGVAAGDRVNGDLSTLLNEADQAMYRAKPGFHAGKLSADAATVLPQV
jgi:PleD family two-component response regulator